MKEPLDLVFPSGFDWPAWVRRWEKMQERYLMRRSERFAAIAGLISATQPSSCSIVDLGCGPGCLMCHLLDALPQSHVVGFDYDPAMLSLAVPRLKPFGGRTSVFRADLRKGDWTHRVSAPVDAVVSATALHWLKPADLEALYHRIASVLRPGGIFLDADHVGSDSTAVQKAREENRARMRAREAPPDSDDWNGFWADYRKALGVDIDKLHCDIAGWEGEGIEEGLPLLWRLDRLRDAGFASVDCFWRLDCDAIYGGLTPPK